MENTLHVGIAQIKIGENGKNLHTLGIGSCIVLYLYDESVNSAGCAHIMLPDSAVVNKENINVKKFADTAIPHLLETLQLRGFSTNNLVAKFTGGAQMFGNENQNIGKQNTEAVVRILKDMNIPVIASDFGGDQGRSAFFDTTTKELKIVKVDCEDLVI